MLSSHSSRHAISSWTIAFWVLFGALGMGLGAFGMGIRASLGASAMTIGSLKHHLIFKELLFFFDTLLNLLLNIGGIFGGLIIIYTGGLDTVVKLL